MSARLPLEIIDEQTEFIVINKPADINFHDEENIGQGFFNQVKSQLGLTHLYPVHRLDKMTSGLLIFAKTLSCAQQFQQIFTQHQIDKYYLAISDKKPKKKQGLIKGDMEKSRRGMWKLLRTQHNPAISQFFSYPLEQGKRLYLVKPLSGKTHQIRVALASIGSPIIGDQRYYSSSHSDRGYLHAFAIRFMLNGQQFQYTLAPSTGTDFISPVMTQQLQAMSQPWLLSWPKI